MLKKRVNSILCQEIPIKEIQNKYYFERSNILEGKEILYIEFASSSDIGYTQSGRSGVHDLGLGDAYVIFSSNNKEPINRISCTTLNRRVNPSYYPFIHKKIDLAKSYIEMAKTDNINTNDSFVIVFYYHSTKHEKSSLPAIVPLNIEYSEVVIQDTSQRIFPFKRNEKLEGKKIRYIEFLAKVSPNGYMYAYADVQGAAYLTLVSVRNEQILYRMPLPLLLGGRNKEQYFFLDDLEVDWPNSYIEMGRTTDLILNTQFNFNIHYVDPDYLKKVESRRRIRRVKR